MAEIIATISPEALEAYQRLTAAGAPPGAATLARAAAEVPSRLSASEVLAAFRSKLITRREARTMLGLDPTPLPELEPEPEPEAPPVPEPEPEAPPVPTSRYPPWPTLDELVERALRPRPAR